MRLLPAGMVGIILAAMFSATMAAVSADFNAIASVLTQDVYHRLIHATPPPRACFASAALLTLALGALTTALSLWIVFSHREALFGLMVTVFGIFMAPTMLPLLVGLTVRATARGAFMRFYLRLLKRPHHACAQDILAASIDYFGSPYGFEGVSL